MAVTNVQISQTPSQTDQPYRNYGGTDIPANVAVSVDATNQIGPVGNEGVGIIPVAASGNVVIGVTMEKIKAGEQGRVRALGPTAWMQADGAITAGTYVDASAATNKVGWVKAHAAGKATIGIALNGAAADGDLVLVMLVGGFNA
jgi:Uncharacterized conserved protein (DUF2190)